MRLEPSSVIRATQAAKNQKKTDLLDPSYQHEIYPVTFRRRSSGSSLPFIDGGAKPLKCRAAGLQKRRRQCMCEGPGMALHC